MSDTVHSIARDVLMRLAEVPVPMWRENLADDLGRVQSVWELKKPLDALRDAGLIKQTRPKVNDEWALTEAGICAAWLLNDSPPSNPADAMEPSD